MNFNWDQITGAIRAVVPMVIAVLVFFGIVPKDIQEQLQTHVVAVLLAVASVGPAVATAWSWWSNRTVNKVQAIAKEAPEVQVLVQPDSSEQLKAVARDPAVPNVVQMNHTDEPGVLKS